MLKSKTQRANITDADLCSAGSITIGPELMEAADILAHEQVAVIDVNNGARFEAYTIRGDRGSGDIKFTGAAERLVQQDDLVTVSPYAASEPAELTAYSPRIVHVDAANTILRVDSAAGPVRVGTGTRAAGCYLDRSSIPDMHGWAERHA